MEAGNAKLNELDREIGGPGVARHQRGKPMIASVVRAQARIDDPAAISTLLKSVPDPQVIRSLIARGGRFFHQVWNREINIDFWFSCNGTILVCFAMGGLSVQQAASVRRWWHTISEDRADRVADQECLIDIVEAVTGQKLTPPGR